MKGDGPPGGQRDRRRVAGRWGSLPCHYLEVGSGKGGLLGGPGLSGGDGLAMECCRSTGHQSREPVVRRWGLVACHSSCKAWGGPVPQCLSGRLVPSQSSRFSRICPGQDSAPSGGNHPDPCSFVDVSIYMSFILSVCSLNEVRPRIWNFRIRSGAQRKEMGQGPGGTDVGVGGSASIDMTISIDTETMNKMLSSC